MMMVMRYTVITKANGVFELMLYFAKEFYNMNVHFLSDVFYFDK